MVTSAARLPAHAGAAFVYLQPVPQDAARLSLRLEGVSALRQDGTAVALSLTFNELSGVESTRERRLASGPLPPGRYVGLALHIGTASLRGEAGDAELLLPEEPTQVEVPFTISTKRAIVLSLRFHYRDSVETGYRLTPVFSAELPAQPPSGLIGLVTSRGSDIVTLFNKVSGRVVGVIPTGSRPHNLTLARADTRAYVALAGDDAIEVIDVLESRIIERLSLSAGDRPVQTAVTPDGRTLLVVNSGSNTVSLVDATALFELRRIPVGDAPASILIDRAGHRAYVFNTLSDTVSILQAPEWNVVATIATDSGPFRGQFDRDEELLYVIHRSSPNLSAIDTTTFATVGKVYVGSGATSLRVNPQNGRIYLGRKNTDIVEVFEPSSLLPIDSIVTREEVAYMAIDGEAGSLHLVLPQAGKLRVVRLVGQATVAEIDVGEDPYWVAFPGER